MFHVMEKRSRKRKENDGFNGRKSGKVRDEGKMCLTGANANALQFRKKHSAQILYHLITHGLFYGFL